MARILLIVAASAAAAACADQSGAPSREQDRQLNEASRMLDEAPGSLANVDDSALEPGNSAGAERPAEPR